MTTFFENQNKEEKMAKAALILVDVQNDFCPGGTLPVMDGDKVVEPLNRMVDFALKHSLPIVASRDWHRPDTVHFKVNRTDGKGWPVHCVQGTDGAKFHKDLKLENAIIVSKGMDPNDDGGYSAFDGVTDIGMSLSELLRVMDVEEVYVGGLATDYCVKATALSAVSAGFKTFFLADGSRAVNINPSDGDNAVREMVQNRVISLSIDTFLLFRDRQNE